MNFVRRFLQQILCHFEVRVVLGAEGLCVPSVNMCATVVLRYFVMCVFKWIFVRIVFVANV